MLLHNTSRMRGRVEGLALSLSLSRCILGQLGVFNPQLDVFSIQLQKWQKEKGDLGTALGENRQAAVCWVGVDKWGR